MQYVANTEEDKKQMLQAIGVKNFDDLIQDIPKNLRTTGLKLPEGLSELELQSLLKKQGQQNKHADRYASFLGAGCYDHYIPSIVNLLATRSEFITAYTPYQGEASQGTLQTIYEYQSMICLLTGMDVSNASMYDGASALAEAVLLAIRHTNKNKVFVADTLHPEYLETIKTHVFNLNTVIERIPSKNGTLDLEWLKKNMTNDAAAVVYQSPNFLGYIEEGYKLVEIAKSKEVLTIASVNPLSLSILEPPGNFGVDVVVGEGQSLGNTMAYGGPHFGFFAVKEALMRKLPGRISGMTQDKEGNRAFVLTLQAREQHIRREKATSNICTNHALCALKGLIFLSALGPNGFRKMGELNVQQSHKTYKALKSIAGLQMLSDAPFFNEFTFTMAKDESKLLASFEKNHLIGPLHLAKFRKEWKNMYLVATTEQRTEDEIQRLKRAIEEA